MTHVRNESDINADLEQRLCKACGFCCDGTLFVNVRIREEEPVDTYKKVGLQIAESTEGLVTMKQPCASFKDQCCQTYQCRPLRCGEFKCKLLKQTGQGTMTETEAMSIIEDSLELRFQYTQLLWTIFPQFKKKAIASTFREIRKASRRLSGKPLIIHRTNKSRLQGLKVELQESLDEHFYDLKTPDQDAPS